ncbi:MAG: alpha/beta hydrolase-fold protein [Bacteroidota bacterium]
MKREITGWFSPSLQKDMPIVTYGDFGFALLLIPTAGADYLEYERFQMIESLSYWINSGKVKVFSIDSINTESWMNKEMLGEHKAIRHNQWNSYVIDEVVPYIKNHTSPDTPIITCGASFGALHSMNLFLKYPDFINGVIAMSGVYDLAYYTNGFWDEQVYYNSPMQYVPNITDHWYLERIRESRHIHILSGRGDHEDPNAAANFAAELYDKGIHYELDIWGHDMRHDWTTWRDMLPHYLNTRF